MASIFESPVDELLHPELSIWRANVGDPVALDLAQPGPAHLSGLDIVSWNVAIGAGRLRQLLEMLFSGAFPGIGADPHRPLIILVQEAYRVDDTVPLDLQRRYHGGALHTVAGDDIVDVARTFGMSLRYAPSMRNGVHRSDRGNAILSTIPFGTSHAFVLPYVRQRRVVVLAEFEGVKDLAVMSAHLDVGGQPREASRLGAFGRGRVRQAEALLRRLAEDRHQHCIVVGADLNTQLGMRDPAIRALVTGGMHLGERVGHWRHTYHGAIRLMLDHVLYRSPRGRIGNVRVMRLDERKRDAGWRVYGSDHHPLLGRVDFSTEVQTG